jgi:hypothetical protein
MASHWKLARCTPGQFCCDLHRVGSEIWLVALTSLIPSHWCGLLRPVLGKIVYVDAAGQPLIVINDVDIANEILDKKGATSSDRPVLHMAGELAGFKGWTVFHMYGQRLKESRKYIHRAIGTQESLKKFDSLFNAEVRKYIKATLCDPDNVQQHIRRYIYSLCISDMRD